MIPEFAVNEWSAISPWREKVRVEQGFELASSL